MSPKADGDRAFLVLGCYTDPMNPRAVITETCGGREVPKLLAALIDRKGVATNVMGRFGGARMSLFAGTVLDCELMPDQSLKAFDAIAICGRSMIDKPYSDARRGIETLEPELRGVTLKPAFQISRSPRTCRNVLLESGTASGCDGVIITMEDRVLDGGPMGDILKHKDNHTIDFGLDRAGNLYVGDRQSEERGLPRWWSRFQGHFQVRKSDLTRINGDFVVAEFSLGELLPNGSRQVVLWKIRRDKTLPNTAQTVARTIAAAGEQLTAADVAMALGLREG